MVLLAGVAGDPCAQRDQRKVAAGSLCKAAPHQHGAVLLRKLLGDGGDGIRGVVHHAILILVQLTDHIFHGSIALDKVQHFKAGGHDGVFPAGIDKGRGVARVQGVGNIGVVGVICLCVLEGQQAVFPRAFGKQGTGARNGGKHAHHLERILQLLGVLLQLFVQTVEAVHLQHKNILGAVLGKIRHQAEFIGVVVCLHDAVGAAHQKQGVALGHPLPGDIVVKRIAGVVQHPDVLPLFDIRHCLHHAGSVADVCLAGKIILLPQSAIQRAEEIGICNVAQVLEAVARILDLRQAEIDPGFLGLCSQFFQLSERIGQLPAVFLQQGLVVGDAVAVVNRGQQIDGTVVEHVLQAGFYIVVGKIIAGKVQQLVGHKVGHGIIDRKSANIRQVARRKHILQAGGGVIAAVRHDLNIYFRVDLMYLLNKGFYLHIGCHKGDGFVRIVFFICFSLTAAAGGQRCRGSCNAASLQKGAAGNFLHHTNTFLTFRRAVLHRTNGVQCCRSYFYTPHRIPHARGLSALGIRRFSHKMTVLLYHRNKSVSSCFLKDFAWKRANNRVLCSRTA